MFSSRDFVLQRKPFQSECLPLRAVLLLAMAIGTVFLVACKKPAKIVVPDVSQQDVDQAQKTLVAAQLTVGTVTGSGPGAYVVSQSLPAGQQVDANTVVNLVAQLPIMVPTLTGSNVTDAVTLLQGLGLRVAFIKKSSVNIFSKPKVEQQDPAPNTAVHPDTLVTLQVSTPPDVSALLGLVSKEPAYQRLKPEYKNALDAFMGNPNTPRSMDPAPAPSAPSAPTK